MDVTPADRLPLWSDYTGFARRHRALIALMLAGGLLVGLVWAGRQPSTYSASTSVALAPVPKYVTDPTTDLVPPEVSIDSDAQLLHNPQVLAAVGAVLGTGPYAAGPHLSVTASPLSHVLHITVQASSAELAARAADAAAAEFIEVRRSALGALRRDQLSQLRLYISTQERLLAKQQARRVVVPARDDLFAAVVELKDSLQELEAARRTPAEVLDAAAAPRRADYANSEVPIVSAMVLGLLAACLLGAARDRVSWAGAPWGQRLRADWGTPLTYINHPEDRRHAV